MAIQSRRNLRRRAPSRLSTTSSGGTKSKKKESPIGSRTEAGGELEADELDALDDDAEPSSTLEIGGKPVHENWPSSTLEIMQHDPDVLGDRRNPGSGGEDRGV